MVKLDSFIKESFRHSTDLVINTLEKHQMIFNQSGIITSYINGEIIHSPTTKLIWFLEMVNVHIPVDFFAINEIKICLHNLILRYNIKTESCKLEPNKIICSYVLPPNSGLVFENRV
ncbi:17384_t:CDS:2 [Gigaspora margarita]|uniref:17384_t:CDS:1 n=1 Tax=Gigaspora margarita TaxID=4874 RepID=A0ABM8W1T4_GIGMA|nr:17384_t:CDS:2 [Gigaspora margarita]